MDDADYRYKLSVEKHKVTLVVWDIIIIGVALFSIWVIPLRIGINKNLLGGAYDYLDLLTWFIYVFDLFVNMRTTYLDAQGHEVVESSKIVRNYISSLRFVVDLLSLVNLPNLMIKNMPDKVLVVFNMFGLLKMQRYFRARRLINSVSSCPTYSG